MNDYSFKLSLIRHGESEINVQPDIMGQTSDVKLTENGKNQAKLLNKKIKSNNEIFDFIYSSTYDRAKNTAELCFPNRNIELVHDIREYDAGDWTGCLRSETLTPEIKLQMGYLDHAFSPPNGESMHQVERRASEWLEKEILYNKYKQDYYKDNKKLNIAVFSHGMTIKCLLHYIMGFDKSFTWKIQIDNTSVTKLEFGRTGWKLLGINDCSHLRSF